MADVLLLPRCLQAQTFLASLRLHGWNYVMKEIPESVLMEQVSAENWCLSVKDIREKELASHRLFHPPSVTLWKDIYQQVINKRLQVKKREVEDMHVTLEDKRVDLMEWALDNTRFDKETVKRLQKAYSSPRLDKKRKSQGRVLLVKWYPEPYAVKLFTGQRFEFKVLLPLTENVHDTEMDMVDVGSLEFPYEEDWEDKTVWEWPRMKHLEEETGEDYGDWIGNGERWYNPEEGMEEEEVEEGEEKLRVPTETIGAAVGLYPISPNLVVSLMADSRDVCVRGVYMQIEIE